MNRFAPARRAVSILTALTLVLAFAAPAAAVDGDKYVALANQKRASVGLAPVAMSDAVNTVSHERATQMANSDVMSHDLSYVSSRLKALGVCFTGYGEIIAWERGYPTYDPARTIEQWWASQGHHDIMVGNFNAAGGSHKTAASNKIYSAMVFVKLCTAPSSSTVIQRLAGADRYSTAAAISRSRFGGGASTVFIATGGSFPDALAGAPAAARANGPILLTAKDALPSATATELDRLNPSKIVILGGSAAVSSAVASRLGSYAGKVVRWWGADRYGTAAAVSKAAFAPGVAVAYISTGSSFPDALSGGAIAGRNGGPILLTKQGALPGATATELARLKPSRIVILGGTSAVSSGVADALRRYATSGSVTRLAGADRYATAVQVSRASYGSAGSNAVFVATGSNFPDGLAGGPVAALVPGPILLVNPTRLPSVVASELDRLDPAKVFVLGGTSAISDGVVRSIDAVLP
ncbi:MAG: cell wall-binding repeat-containing protein [Chloroflexota bacterium]|nr:cell wall-binding repeat-containing protein [Chloroflexota bacterium]